MEKGRVFCAGLRYRQDFLAKPGGRVGESGRQQRGSAVAGVAMQHLDNRFRPCIVDGSAAVGPFPGADRGGAATLAVHGG